MNNSKISFNSLALLIASVLILFSLTSLSSASIISYNNVQINIQTSNIQTGDFTVSAFNMTGYQEASSQTHYPAASFELPAGQYIFTVTANNQTNSIYPSPLGLGAASSGSSSSPSIPLSPIYLAPVTEYGYSVQQISNAMTITIATQDVSSFPTNTLTIQALFPNGTAAVGASVSASTIGSFYYWGYNPNIITWITTGPDGYATLVTPIAPEQIDAWSWIPQIPTTAAPTNSPGTAPPPVGTSAPSSPTLIIRPVYLGLAGSTFIIPPQTTAKITLLPQQQNYWVTPYVTATSGGMSPTASTPSSSSLAGPGAIPASVYAQQQGNPALQATPTTAPSSSTPSGNPAVPEFQPWIILPLFIAAVLLAGLFLKRRQPDAMRIIKA
jgi:hypothetical protein